MGSLQGQDPPVLYPKLDTVAGQLPGGPSGGAKGFLINVTSNPFFAGVSLYVIAH